MLATRRACEARVTPENTHAHCAYVAGFVVFLVMFSRDISWAVVCYVFAEEL